ncbi:MAG: hypothetical protein LBH53_01420 [Puniceicoccales bacterium]|jgi:hypothetical protein|nr:hypothetical protein [Puniceicoccales bacterium]
MKFSVGKIDAFVMAVENFLDKVDLDRPDNDEDRSAALEDVETQRRELTSGKISHTRL